jgi:DNA-binding FrmR family transcriptional regulator
MSHTASPELPNRLRRAQGHLVTIIKMIEEGREGLETAQQMQAVVSALEAAKTMLVVDHIEHHLEAVIGPLPKEARDELTRLSKLATYL